MLINIPRPPPDPPFQPKPSMAPLCMSEMLRGKLTLSLFSIEYWFLKKKEIVTNDCNMFFWVSFIRTIFFVIPSMLAANLI